MTDETSQRGRVADVSRGAARRAALEDAFDYRGDVTLDLEDGRRFEGFVFNRDASGETPWLEIFPAEEDSKPVRIRYSDISGLAFTGRDTADGRSWEAWVAKHQDK